jgi:hypothetical protein
MNDEALIEDCRQRVLALSWEEVINGVYLGGGNAADLGGPWREYSSRVSVILEGSKLFNSQYFQFGTVTKSSFLSESPEYSTLFLDAGFSWCLLLTAAGHHGLSRV